MAKLIQFFAVGNTSTSEAVSATNANKTIQYLVTLSEAPSSAIQLDFTSSDTTEGRVLTPTLKFNAANFSFPQFLEIEGQDDSENDRNVSYKINVKLTTQDKQFLTPSAIQVTNVDDGRDVPVIWSGSNAADAKIGGAGHDSLSGGNGNDTLQGDAGNDTIAGGAGDDSLVGGEGNDSILGAAGNDSLDGGADNDTLFGGVGLDTADFSRSSQAIILDLASGRAQGQGNDVLSEIENAIGGSGNDSLTGDSLANLIQGGTGNDTLAGGAGNDSLFGGGNIDFVDFSRSTVAIRLNLATGTAQGDGNDVLREIENVIGGSGNDSLTGDSLANRIEGGGGNDAVLGSAGNDSLSGSAGNDTLSGGEGNDWLNGGAGNDYLLGGAGVDVADFSLTTGGITVNLTSGIATGEGNDVLKEIENVIGGTGNDILTGDSLANRLLGGGGNDSLDGGANNDTLVGGLGLDTADFSRSTQAIILNLASGTAQGQGNDVLSEIENAIGSSGNDSLTGDSIANRMEGGAGNDTLTGGAGNDSLFGGGNIDFVDFSRSTVAIRLNLATGTAQGEGNDVLREIENVIGGSGNDSLTGDWLANRIEGGSGNDAVLGSAGNDSLLGSGGNDTLSGGEGNDWLSGGAGNDSLLGGAGIDVADFSLTTGGITVNLTIGTSKGEGDDVLKEIENVIGGTGNDNFTGDSLANRLLGGAGNDSLIGGAGNDTLTGCVEGASGGSGDLDRLTGGAGSDFFQLGTSSGIFYNDNQTTSNGSAHYALITDFQSGVDKLILSGKASNYELRKVTLSSVNQYELYQNKPITDELVSVIQSSDSLTVMNTINNAIFV
jgi:Ca2+-binding RTX toxin-like protein